MVVAVVGIQVVVSEIQVSEEAVVVVEIMWVMRRRDRRSRRFVGFDIFWVLGFGF